MPGPAKRPASRGKTSAQRGIRPARSGSSGAAKPGGTHLESEDYPWTINVGNHPKRTDSPAYVIARKLMNEIAPTKDWYYGAGPYQDHHGAALWVKDEDGWFLLKNLAGIEWSAQFCADPKKVDALRLNAKRLYAKFPLAALALKDMGFDLNALLNAPVTDAAGVSRWTDSICNAGVPLAAPWHTGVLATKQRPKGVLPVTATAAAKGTAANASPTASAKGARPPSAGQKVVAGGVHHYPTPITDIQFFKRDDFSLWVTDEEGAVAAVVPTKKRKGAKQTSEVVYATPGTKLHAQWLARHRRGQRLVLPANHDLTKKALRKTRRMRAAS